LPEPNSPSTDGMVLIGTYCEGEVDAFWNPPNGGVFFIDRDTGFLLGNQICFKDTAEEARAYADKRLLPQGVLEIPMW
jgi:hypothetical protein